MDCRSGLRFASSLVAAFVHRAACSVHLVAVGYRWKFSARQLNGRWPKMAEKMAWMAGDGSHVDKVHEKPTYPGEVRVRRGHGGTILHRARCDPRVVGRNRGSCGSQLIDDGSVMLGGSLRNNNETDPLFGQERFELRSVSCLAAASSKSGKKLPDDDRRDQDQRCFPNSAYCGRGSSHGMAVDGRVKQNWCHRCHFQSSGSSLRCSDSALENSSNSSCVHVPNRSSRSWCSVLFSGLKVFSSSRTITRLMLVPRSRAAVRMRS